MLFSPEKCHLSIRLSTNGFSFYIALIEQQRLLFQKSHSITAPSTYFEEAKAIMYSEEMMFADFRSCSVVINDSRTLITPPVIDEQGARALYNATYRHPANTLLSNPLLRSGHTIWFGADSRILSFLKRSFTYNNITTSHTLVLEILHQHTTPDAPWQLFVDAQLDHLTFYLFHHGLLHSITHRTFVTSADAAYHILNLWQTAAINPQTAPLNLVGNAFAINEIRPLLQRYITTVTDLPLTIPESLLSETVDPLIPIDIAHLISTLST